MIFIMFIIHSKIEYFLIESATPSWEHDYKLIKHIEKYPKPKLLLQVQFLLPIKNGIATLFMPF